jgi:hypothetical protein
MPCLEGKPVEVNMFFTFKMEGGSRVLLKDLPLLDFLSAVKGIREANIYLDTREMACPFEVRFQLYQPFQLNRVGEVGEPNSARRFLIEWLQRVHLNIPPRQLNAVLGDSMTIQVPCITVNLGSSAGGGASQ